VTPPEKDGGFGRTLYQKLPAHDMEEAGVRVDELGLVFFGEVCPSLYGTAITANGNNYVSTPEYPKVCKNQFRCLPQY
jgi:hypothetical protein